MGFGLEPIHSTACECGECGGGKRYLQTATGGTRRGAARTVWDTAYGCCGPVFGSVVLVYSHGAERTEVEVQVPPTEYRLLLSTDKSSKSLAAKDDGFQWPGQ